MKRPLLVLTLFSCFLAGPLGAGDVPPEFLAAAAERRTEIPLGGDFQPDPKVPVFVAVGHGGRILLSRDDGASWEQVFWGYPGADHSIWATKEVSYDAGVFVVPMGWGAIGTWLASEDGVNWRHFTDGKTTLDGVKEAKEDPTAMPSTYGMASGKGVFVSGGYMTMGASADLGKTFSTFSLRSFKDDPRPRKLVTHHVKPLYCGDASGRFLALGNDRSNENTVFGNLFASDDLGQTWTWLEPELLNAKCQGYSAMLSNGELVMIVDAAGENAFVSADAGKTWSGPYVTGTNRATLSVVNGEFWLIGKESRATRDGETWRSLPEGIPAGQIVASPEGTLISIERKRYDIQRSTDGCQTWQIVHRFDPPETEHIHGAQGLRDLAFGYVTAAPVK